LTSSNLTADYHQTSFGRVPLFRDLTLDWYKSAIRELADGRRSRVMDSKLLYFGRGFADSWRNRSQTVIVPGDLRSAYETAVSRLILPNLRNKNLTFIDLGVGDFYKGYVILKTLLPEIDDTLNYVFYDISYEMLTSVLDTSVPEFKSILKTIYDRHELIGINAEFINLAKCEEVLPVSSHRCFGLFGNTLGSDANPARLLECIRNLLSADDVFVAELQLIEPEPPSDQELLNHFSLTKRFYVGPFLALGCSESQLELAVKTESSQAYETVNVSCRVTRAFVANIEALGYSQTIPEGEYKVLQIRKYRRESLEQLLRSAGFQVVDSYCTFGSTPGARAFAYLVARKQTLPLDSHRTRSV